jgi:hypothetical protein
MSGMEDGGAVALSGFLYQLLGSAAGLASATADPLAILYLEPSGEDALLSLTSGATLQQFKYSADRREIGPQELAEILLKLENHDSGNSSWRLSTNRPFSPGVNLLLPGASPDPKLLARIGLKNRSVIERCINKLNVDCLTFTALSEQLSERGRRFGLTADEMQQGADRLVGSMMRIIRERNAGVAIDHAFLDRQLVGFPNPGRLRGPDRATEVATDLDELARSHLEGPNLDNAIRRRVLVLHR